MSITDIINFLKTDLDKTDIILNSCATDALIAKTEKHFGIKLPDDIKQFFKFTNGFVSDEDQFRIIPLQEIIDFSAIRSNKTFYIAEYLTYCDMWKLEVDRKDYNNYSISCIYYDGIETILTTSFSEFLSHFLIAGVFEPNGLYDWHEQIRLAKGLVNKIHL